MKITVQELDPQAGCYRPLTGGDKLDPAIGLTDLCDGGTATAELRGGVDELRLVISYGDLAFSASTTPPDPTVTMTLDGVSSSPPDLSITTVHRAGPTAFTATFRAPAEAVSVMQVGASVTAGFSRGPLGAYTVDAPTVTTIIEACQAHSGACERTAGVGTVLVSVTAPGTSATTAGTLTSSLDGVLQAGSTPVTLGREPGSANMVTGTATVSVPSAPEGTVWTVNAQIGDATGTSTGVTLRAPTMTVGVDQCAAAGACTVTADVASVAVRVTTSGTASGTGTITSALGGVEQATTYPIDLAPLPGEVDVVGGVAFVPVPGAAGGTPWSLDVQTERASARAPVITLKAPTVTAALSACSSGPCTVAAGESVVYALTVPLGLHGTEATVSAFLGSAPDVGPLTLHLRTTDHAAQTVTGSLPLTVPTPATGAGPSAHTWVINANVDGYDAPSIVATIQ